MSRYDIFENESKIKFELNVSLELISSHNKKESKRMTTGNVPLVFHMQ